MTANLLTKKDLAKRWLVTGGAGFIGSHVVDLLVSAGVPVTVYDNLSLSTDRFIRPYLRSKQITFWKADLLDLPTLTKAMKGQDIVWHLGANTSITVGYTDHRRDLDNDVIATWNVLEAMTRSGVSELLFASSGAVYGESIKGQLRESSGPLLPLSLYGAGKLASEAFVASYCHLFGLKAWIFRFGNVLGDRMNHGIIFDFIAKLKGDRQTLEILGTGRGQKNYFLVEGSIHGMLYTRQKLPSGPFPVLVNLGNNSTSTVMTIAAIVAAELAITNLKYRFTGTPRGWPGDQPVVLLDTTRINDLGWLAKQTSDEAVRTATRRLLGKEKFSLTLETLGRAARVERAKG